MAASTSIPLSKKSQAIFVAYYSSVQNILKDFRSSTRERFEQIDKEYQREVDSTEEQRRAKAANKTGDPNRFQNITVPIIMPQVESAVTYQASVFLSGYPIFGTVSSPEYIDEALQMETIIEDQATRGGWTKEFMIFFRDGFKYNFAPIEVTWKREVTAAIETSLETSLDEGLPKEVIWAGNTIKRLDPYNTFVDPRVDPTKVYKEGEFAGYIENMTRIQLKKFIEELPDKLLANIPDAFASGISSSNISSECPGYYIPKVNKDVIDPKCENVGMNWDTWAGLSDAKNRLEYKDMYQVTTLYCRILPAEFNLRVPRRNIPQIYKLIIVNHEHIIYCERQTNAHNYIPILIGQPYEDGLAYQTKSLATNASPFQYVASTYMNSIIHSRRRAISDRTLYDPSRITSAAINSENPSAKIPVRPAAYGKNIADSVYPFPYREDQAAASMAQVRDLIELSNSLSGQNRVTQGQFQKGNRTLQEFDRVMANANGRDQITSVLLEAQVLTPLKLILKLNILQYQGGTSIYNRDKQQLIEIDPVKLRKAVVEFKITDGLIPASKLMNGDTFATAIQVIGSSPQIAGSYNTAPMFSYLMKIQGADLAPFEKSQEQIAYEQAVQQWQQLAFEGIKNGIDPSKLPPQPIPADYGYDPKANKPAPETAVSASA